MSTQELVMLGLGVEANNHDSEHSFLASAIQDALEPHALELQDMIQAILAATKGAILMQRSQEQDLTTIQVTQKLGAFYTAMLQAREALTK
jgi:hypothetical protein